MPAPGRDVVGDLSPEAAERVAAEAAQSHLADTVGELRSSNRIWKGVAAAFALVVLGQGLSIATLVQRHTEHWGLLMPDVAQGTLRVVLDVREGLNRLGDAYNHLADAKALEEFVRLREQWNRAEHETAFQAAACMMAPAEQRRFKAYFDGPEGPRRRFERGEFEGGWRRIETQGFPVVIGRENGLVRYEVPFRRFDHHPSRPAPETLDGIARFTAAKNRDAFTLCNHRAYVITDFVAVYPNRNPQP